MPLLQVRDRFQVTLPVKIRKALRIKVGDVIEAVLEDNVLILRPKAVVKRRRMEQLNSLVRGLGQEAAKKGITEEKLNEMMEETRTQVYQKTYGK